jgi:hypothetical protein
MRARAAAVAGAALLALAGCSALPFGFPSGSPSPSGSATPSDAPIGTPFGDVAPREQVTDELGTYLHITLSPVAAAATEVDPAAVQSSVEGSGWDRASLLEAQRFVATFVAEQTIDSSALDRDDHGWEQWLANTAPTYFGAGVDEVISSPDSGADRPVPIFNDPDGFTPRLVRDGMPRLDDATIVVESLDSIPREGGEWLEVSGTSDVAYRLSDEEARAALLAQGYDAGTIDTMPALNDDEDGHYLVRLEWTYAVERTGEGWVIRDYDLAWEATVEGLSQA